MSILSGTVAPAFAAVSDLLEQNLASGAEIGASLYVNVEGEDVVDLWGGWHDEERSAPWGEHSIVNVFSATKTVTSLAVLLLVDRGLIDLDAPVADYWPEFAENGKGGIRVRHLLSHTAGVSGWEQPFVFEDAFDIEAATAKLARHSGWWEPGTFSCYHASTYGHLTSELIRRVTGVGAEAFIERELAGPLEADFVLAVNPADEPRVATVYPLPEGPAPQVATAGGVPTLIESINAKTRAGSFSANIQDDPRELFNSERWRRAGFAGSGGHTNARGLGRILSVIGNGGVSRGIRMLSPATIELIFQAQAIGVDAYYRKPIRWGIGYALSSEGGNRRGPLPFLRADSRTCFWYGTGGAVGLVDVQRGLTMAYVMNRCQEGKQSLNGVYYDAVYAALEGRG